MKFFVVIFALIAAALAAPQFGGGFGGSGQWINKISNAGRLICKLFSSAAANAGASSQTFNQGGGFSPYGGFGGGLSGSASNAAASSQTFNQVRKVLGEN